MSISENEQQNLKVQLFNHPCLLFARIQQMAAPFANKASGKKARVIFNVKNELKIPFLESMDQLFECSFQIPNPV